MKPTVLLDVHMEDLEAILSQNWDVRTVSKEIGSSSVDEIIQYAEKTKCIIVSDNDELGRKLSSGLFVVSIDSADRAKIINEKLGKIEIPSNESVTSSKNSLEFCKQHFYLL